MSNKTPSHRFPLSLRTPHILIKTATLQRPSASRTTTVIEIRVVSCNPMYYNLPTKATKKRLPHTHTHTHKAPAVPTWQFELVVAFQKLASLGKDSTLPYRLTFGKCFFASLLGELSPAGGRVVGGPFRWCCFASPPSGGAVFPLSPVGWCCLASSSFPN